MRFAATRRIAALAAAAVAGVGTPALLLARAPRDAGLDEIAELDAALGEVRTAREREGVFRVRPRGLLAAVALYLEALLVFAVTPSPLEWHLSTAMNRLLLQPWPLLLLGLFTAVRAPEEAPGRARRPERPKHAWTGIVVRSSPPPPAEPDHRREDEHR